MASKAPGMKEEEAPLIVFIPRNHILVLGMAVTIINCAGTLKHNGLHVARD